MAWFAVIGLAIDAANSIGKSFADDKIEKYEKGFRQRIEGMQTQLANARAEYSNTMTEARNTYTKAAVVEQGTNAVINYRQRQTALGNNRDALVRTALRAADASVTGPYQQRLMAASQLGAVTAQLTAAGVGGGSAEALSRIMGVQADLRLSAANRIAEQQKSEYAGQIGSVEGAMANPAVINIMAAMDYGKTVPDFVPHAQDGTTSLMDRLDWSKIIPLGVGAAKAWGSGSSSALDGTKPGNSFGVMQSDQASGSNMFLDGSAASGANLFI